LFPHIAGNVYLLLVAVMFLYLKEKWHVLLESRFLGEGEGKILTCFAYYLHMMLFVFCSLYKQTRTHARSATV
jgi:hypothetical protein